MRVTHQRALGATLALASFLSGIAVAETPAPVDAAQEEEFLDVLPKFAGPKVIYAAANRMGGRAAREGITFKQTPYALEV